MKDSRVSNETSSKRTGWLKILGLVGGVGVVLIAVLYFVVTSGAFFKGVILPKIGKSLNSQLAVSDASISPFSQVVLRDISLIPNGSDKPAFVAKELKARYSLMSIIGGNISVEEVTLASPVIHVIQNADGTSNLDPLTQMEKAGSEPTAKTEAAPLKLSIGTVKLTDGIVRKTTTVNDGVSETLEITGLNITLTNLKNGEDGKLDIAALVTMVATAGPSKPASELSGKLTGNWAFGFTQELKPKAITGRLVFNVDKAGGDYAELLSLSVTAETDVTPTEIRRVALAFAKGGASLGELRVSGPFDMEKVEGVLNADVVGVDKRVLNLAGASAGIDFGDCAVASTNTITVSAGGSSLAIGGRFNLERLRVTQSGQSTPELDLSADYDVKVDNTAETAVLRSFNAAATQNKRPLLNAQLATPMTLNWGKNAAAAGDSALNVTITGLSLGDWRAFAADLSPAGIVNATFKLTSQQAGKQIGFQLNGGITGLSATVGDTKINPSDFRIEVSGRGEDIRAFKLDHYLLALSQQNESGLIVSGSGDFNADTRATDLQLTVQSALPRLLAIVSKDGVNLLSGALQFKGRVQSTAQSQSVAGDLSIDGLRTAGPNTTPLSAKLGLDASVTTNILDLRKCVLSLTPTSRAANQLQLAGRVDMSASDAMTGNLKLTSEALDLTSYYDMFAGQSATKQPAQTPPTTSLASDEPDPVVLPFRNFVVDASVARLFLREVDIKDLRSTLSLDGGKVVLKPFTMQLNGAPVSASANLDLGVRGWNYDVAFDANRVPVAPLANSFAPDYRGQANGTLIAGAQVQGTGMSGASLQRNLGGHFNLSLTNASIQLAGKKVKRIVTPIAAVLGLDELLRSPLTQMDVRVGLGGGAIDVKQCEVLSQAFRADLGGRIPIATVLTNSPLTNWPVNLSLSRSLAEKARLLTADTPTNATFVTLPTFAWVVGTIGSPDARTDKLVIAGLVSRSLGGATQLIGGRAGNILQGVGNILTGQPAQQTSTNSTTGSTNRAAPFNPLDLLRKPKDK